MVFYTPNQLGMYNVNIHYIYIALLLRVFTVTKFLVMLGVRYTVVLNALKF